MAPQTRSSTARNFDTNHIGHNNGRKTLNVSLIHFIFGKKYFFWLTCEWFSNYNS